MTILQTGFLPIFVEKTRAEGEQKTANSQANPSEKTETKQSQAAKNFLAKLPVNQPWETLSKKIDQVSLGDLRVVTAKYLESKGEKKFLEQAHIKIAYGKDNSRHEQNVEVLKDRLERSIKELNKEAGRDIIPETVANSIDELLLDDKKAKAALVKPVVDALGKKDPLAAAKHVYSFLLTLEATESQRLQQY